MLTRVGASISATLVTVGVILAILRVSWLADHEVNVEHRATLAEAAAAEGSSERSARLATVHLYGHQRVVFEVCAADPMRPEAWAGTMALAVWRPRSEEVMTRSALDEAVLGLVQRSETHACLLLGRGRVELEDDYAVEAIFDEARPAALEDIPLTVRVLARHDLSAPDFLSVALAWLGSIGLVAFLALRRREPDADPALAEEDPWAEAQAAARPALFTRASALLTKLAMAVPELVVIAGLIVVVLAFVGSGGLPPGAALGLAVGTLLALFEIGVAFALTPGPGLRARLLLLGLVAPRRAYLWFPGALLAGVALVQLATLATRLVPSTGQSAIQSFVSWPSGLLSFAALAVVAPLAEEIFFRGFVYGLLERRGRVLAFAGAWLLFVLAHLPQTFHQWGALAAILVTGFGLSALRAASGSTLVAATAHLVYNGLLALSGLIP